MEKFLVKYIFAFACTYSCFGNPQPFSYNFKTHFLSDIIQNDSFTTYLKLNAQFDEFDIITKYLSSKKPVVGFPKENNAYVSNLADFLYKITGGNCLVVINNFEGVNLKSTSPITVILRRFSVALIERSYLPGKTMETLWVPYNGISNLNGNFTLNKLLNQSIAEMRHNCHISKMFTPLTMWYWPIGYCVELDPATFPLSTKPWQCQIQVELFMPDKIFQYGKYTHIFQHANTIHFSFMPSSIPPINIFIDFNSVHEYDDVSLISWLSRSNDLFPYTASAYAAITDITLSIQVRYDKAVSKIVKLRCQLFNLNMLSLCNQCSNLLRIQKLSLNSISTHQVLNLDKLREIDSFSGGLDNLESCLDSFSLADQIAYFSKSEPTAVKQPLLHLHKIRAKYLDKIMLLGFGYASVIKLLLGNVTKTKPELFDREYPKYSDITYGRFGWISQMPVEGHGALLQIENNFGKLRFVSCGSRGIQPYPFNQIVDVFDSSVWIWIMVAAALLYLSKLHLTGSSSKNVSSSNIMCVIKLLLEQGDPFPPSLANLKQLRFVISGALLAGVVISNAFKSENVYNIVKPRHHLPYHTIDELVADGYNIYSRIWSFLFNYCRKYSPRFTKITTKDKIDFTYGIVCAGGYTEAYSDWEYVEAVNILKDIIVDAPVEVKPLTYILNQTRMHPGIGQVFKDSLDVLNPLLIVNIIPYDMLNNVFEGRSLKNIFWKKQNELIFRDLQNCNKSAWVLPDYLVQSISRILKRNGRYSNVGVSTHTKSYVVFDIDGSVPFSIFQRISRISASGILEWWPNFINRTDLFDNDITLPTRPSMSGNIRMLFFLLDGGLVVGGLWLIVELRRQIFKVVKTAVNLLYEWVVIKAQFCWALRIFKLSRS